ncbi:MAG: ABC transporter ATP-binding protein [Clostridia bacterium]|nr:ABC transporter ATP-binding protein [Clostridia bacterium]
MNKNPQGPNSDKAIRDAQNQRKPKNAKSTILRLLRTMMQDRALFALAIALSITGNLLGLLGPRLAGEAIDAIGADGVILWDTVIAKCALMLVSYAASAALSYALTMLMIHISRGVVYRMRGQAFDNLMRLPVSYYDTHPSGDIISRISYDIDTVNASLSNDIVQILSTLVTVFGSLGFMISISPRLLLVFCVTVPLSLYAARRRATVTKPLFRARSRKLGELNGFVEEQLSGLTTLRAYCREDAAVEKFDAINEEAVVAYYNSEYQGSVVGPLVNFINNLSLALVSVFGALLFCAGQMSIGAISSFVLYSRRFSGPINEAANVFGEMQSALAAAERVFAMIDEPAEPADAEAAQPIGDVQGHVQLDHVTFGYEEGKPILKDFTADVRPGRMIAVVGPTGAGKTTLISLLMRFYEAQEGSIRVDGKPLDAVTRDSLRAAYAMVLQDTWLFHGTVYENLRYGSEHATREQVIAAAKAAHADSFIRRLPQGYDTVLTDDGANISKGQKQLLTIARAMLLESRMVILDEATSNVDTRVEKLIQKAMRELMAGKTCFVIAHRLSTIESADEILVIDHGEIVERGTHASLMQQKGFYYGMYRAQFE